MKFYCENCNRSFFCADTVRESYGLKGPWYEEFFACPFCALDGWTEVVSDEED